MAPLEPRCLPSIPLQGWRPPPPPAPRYRGDYLRYLLEHQQFQAPSFSPGRRKVFISYHHVDQAEVGAFVDEFGRSEVFIHRALGVEIDDDIIDSFNTDYVMRRIRQLYLEDSTVTIVMLGRCTWARRYVDWEIQSSLRQSADGPSPNGLMGIILSSEGSTATAPERLSVNLPKRDGTDGYARWYTYPGSPDTLRNWIEDAFKARTTRVNLIRNSRDRYSNNKSCI